MCVCMQCGYDCGVCVCVYMTVWVCVCGVDMTVMYDDDVCI